MQPSTYLSPAEHSDGIQAPAPATARGSWHTPPQMRISAGGEASEEAPPSPRTHIAEALA